MATTTLRLGLRKPVPADTVDVVNDLSDNFQDIDDKVAVLAKNNLYTVFNEFSAGSGLQSVWIHSGGGTNPGGAFAVSVGNANTRIVTLRSAAAQISQFIEGQKSDADPVFRVGPTGNYTGKGQSNFGDGAFGDALGYTRIGNTGGAAQISAQHGTLPDAALILRSKGTGSIILQTSTSVTMFGVTTDGQLQISGGANTDTDVGAAGAAEALPAQPTGYLIVSIGEIPRKIPYYAE